MNNLCVIPARGGSKIEKPIIAWSIHSAIESSCFSNVVVSTDDPDIASVALEYGAEVPFIRPASLSNDWQVHDK